MQKSLAKRLDAAYDYLIENEDTKVICTGGQGTGEDITEAPVVEMPLDETVTPADSTEAAVEKTEPSASKEEKEAVTEAVERLLDRGELASRTETDEVKYIRMIGQVKE